jgi:hypothetical protein
LFSRSGGVVGLINNDNSAADNHHNSAADNYHNSAADNHRNSTADNHRNLDLVFFPSFQILLKILYLAAEIVIKKIINENCFIPFIAFAHAGILHFKIPSEIS